MESTRPAQELDATVRRFAHDWVDVAQPDVGRRLVADPILVLGATGTTPIPRDVFLEHVRRRAEAAANSRTDLGAVTAHALGEVMILATVTWRFAHGDATSELVSDFLLRRTTGDDLQCVAYLPRTNVLDRLRSEA